MSHGTPVPGAPQSEAAGELGQPSADGPKRPSLREPSRLEQRVVRAAEAALAERQFVSAVDILTGVGWLSSSHLDYWRQGRCDCLERVTTANLHKLSDAMAILRRWAKTRGLLPRETAYVTRTRDRRPLRFSVSGDPKIEQAYRTHWISPELSERKRERLAAKQDEPPQLVVISPLREWACARCSGTGGLLFMQDSHPLCLSCAGLDHLVFLPAGNTALTRRAQRASDLSAVVLRFSRARKRYERQGLLVEGAALEQAEHECLSDLKVRPSPKER